MPHQWQGSMSVLSFQRRAGRCKRLGQTRLDSRLQRGLTAHLRTATMKVYNAMWAMIQKSEADGCSASTTWQKGARSDRTVVQQGEQQATHGGRGAALPAGGAGRPDLPRGRTRGPQTREGRRGADPKGSEENVAHRGEGGAQVQRQGRPGVRHQPLHDQVPQHGPRPLQLCWPSRRSSTTRTSRSCA